MSESTALSEVAHRYMDTAAAFIQSVVILDDLAVMSQAHHRISIDEPAPDLVVPEYPTPSASVADPVRIAQRGVHLDADAVIKSFADIGSVCAVLNPAPDDDYEQTVARAAVRADIVVLDWKIHGSAGDNALNILQNILTSDLNGPRMRLIAVYTGEPNLQSISKRIRSAIRDYYEHDELRMDGLFRISKGPVRVVVLAKPGGTSGSLAEYEDQEVAEADLADRLVNEFMLMNAGLLRNVALAGIASIRNASHRILTRFNRHLDAAYLGHRLLLRFPPDAEDQVVSALGAEVLSVMEADRPGVQADIIAIRQWLIDRQQEFVEQDPVQQERTSQDETEQQDVSPTVDLRTPFDSSSVDSIVDLWNDLLLYGVEAENVALPQGGKKELKKRSTEAFATTAEMAMHSNRDFARLLNLKTRYANRKPRLTLGTIVVDLSENPAGFLLCLQPKCDSIRLEVDTGFPFLPLEVINTDTSESAFDLVIKIEKDKWRYLAFEPSPSLLVVRSFSPHKDEVGNILPPGEVLAEGDLSAGFVFTDTDNAAYRWIAEMKDEHALKISGAVASTLARPGPDDSEWLRRAAQRSR